MAAVAVHPAPHIHSGITVRSLTYATLSALAIPVAAGVAVYGAQAVAVLAAALAGALAAEALCAAARGWRVEETLAQGGAAITGLLLGLCLSPGIPIWMAALGGAVGIALGKQAFGGLGSNVFNPAMVGLVFLLTSFPNHMGLWMDPAAGGQASSALQLAKEGAASVPSAVALLTGQAAGPIGGTVALAVLLAGLLLLSARVIDWRAPVGLLAGVAILSWATGRSVSLHLLGGLTLIGAFFLAADPVTTPLYSRGRFLFGLSAGLLAMVTRLWGGFEDGVPFAILLMNGITPLINRSLRPRPLVAGRRAAAGAETLAARWLRTPELRVAAVLTLVAALSGGLLAAFYQVTAPMIARQQEMQELEVGLKGVFAKAASFQPIEGTSEARAFLARGASGAPLGVGLIVEAEGFGGPIRLAVGVDPQARTLTGIRVLKHSETPGLGARIEEPAFWSQFTGKSVDDPFVVDVDVDGVSGATVSSWAVTEAVMNAAQQAMEAWGSAQ